MSMSPEQMAQSMIDNMPEKTGKSLDEWLAVVEASGLEKHGDIVKHLKSEHGMTHGFANLVSQIARQPRDVAPPTPDELVSAQYAGAKAGLEPIYQAIADRVTEFGDDVDLSPKKTYVSLRRGKQFGIVKPSTKTRVDVGINLKGVEPTDRLTPGKSFGGMVSHQVAVTDVADVDDQLIGWLFEAYDRA